LKVLAILHEKTIIHRDISPLTILVDTNDNVVMQDFRLAALTNGKKVALLSLRPSDKRFSFPQLLRGEPCSYDADVWGVVALWYWMQTGRYLLTEEQVSEVTNENHANHVSQILASIPDGMSKDVLMALEHGGSLDSLLRIFAE
jgi:serine/threonine protein kinase